MPSWADPEFRANYLIVGAQKCGTTALNAYLSAHRDICTAGFGRRPDSSDLRRPQEAHFFDDERFFPADASPEYALYHLHFRHHATETAIGETTPAYMYLPEVAPRLKDYNPALKLLFILRNPAERAYSHYSMVRARLGQESLPFSLAIRLEPLRLWWARRFLGGQSPLDRIRRSKWIRRHAYVSRGMYMAQIRNMLRHFPREQMLFLRNEDLRARHRETLARVFEFLGVETMDFPEPKSGFSGEYRPMAAADRAFLAKKFAREIGELEKFLGWDLAAWRGVAR